MLIDIPLLKLRYEILNVTLEELASDVDVPTQILEAEATRKSWVQWWPYPDPSTAVAPPTTPEVATNSHLSDAVVAGVDDDTDDTDDDSELEIGSQAFLHDTALRLQVFNMAKEVYLSHKYAGLESALIDRAREATNGMSIAPQDLKHLSSIFKDLASNMSTGKSLSIGTTDDGLPTVIIRDLRGRNA